MDYFKKGFIKYIPEFVLPKFKPIIVDEIKKDDITIGEIGAINLKNVNFDKETELNKYIKSIEEIQSEDCERIFIEGCENFEVKIIDRFKRHLNLFMEDGELVKLSNLSLVMKKMFDILGEDLKNKEVLILCSDIEKTKCIIKEVAKEAKFITVYGLKEEEGEKLYEYILDEIGLSIFHTKNFYNIIDNYSIIINFLDKVSLKNSTAKKSSIIFDFTANKCGAYLISDFGYNLKDMGIRKTSWFDSIINSQTVEFLSGNSANNIKPRYIITKDNNTYTLEEYIDLFIKVTGRF